MLIILFYIICEFRVDLALFTLGFYWEACFEQHFRAGVGL